jgi:hypothetical protein
MPFVYYLILFYSLFVYYNLYCEEELTLVEMVRVFYLIHRKMSCMLVAHAYNPSYLGGRDQEDHGSNKP